MAVVLRAARPHRRPQRLARLARPVAAVHRGRHGAVHPVPDRSRDRPVPPGDQRAEVRPHPRHRGGRPDHPPRDVLPDERQLLLRRLLQGGGDPLRLGAADHAPGRRRLRLRARDPVGHGLRGRRRGLPAVAGRRRAARRADPAPRQEGQLLAHRPARPGRPVLGDLRRPRSRLRRRRRPGGRRGPVPRGLEPRLHAVRDRPGAQQGGLPRPRPAAPAQHRHRHGPGARRAAAAGRGEPVRDRRGPPRPRPGGRAGRRHVRRRHRRRARRHRQPVAGAGRGPRDRRPAARGRRPRPQRAHAHGRRGPPRQRGRRLRAAPPGPPCGARDAPARGPDPRPARAAAGEHGADEPLVPRAGAPTSAASRPSRTPRRRRSAAPSTPARRGSPPRPTAPARRAGGRCPATRPSRCTTPTASRST